MAKSDRIFERELDSKSSRLLFSPSFNKTIDELKKRKITLPSIPTDSELDFSNYGFPQNGELVATIDKMGKYPLDQKNGQDFCNKVPLCAYDESVNKFEGLEGTAFLTSHSMIIHGENDFIPVSLLTFYFYTRSMTLSEGSDYIKYSEDLETDSKRDYITDRELLLGTNVPENSVIFIDGPLIGSQMTKYTLDLNNLLLKKGIIPIFFVKNSNSNLVIDNIEPLKKKYNSDMHWAYSTLKEGERTNFFEYKDKTNPKFAKVFCYLKAFDISPQRVEIDIHTYQKYSNNIDNILDMVYYLLIVQGDLKNPQLRSIAIAEKYARATLKLINFVKMMKDLGITPTMNQERFAW